MAVTRFGVSLENDLLEALDNYVKTNNFPNRSQAVRQLIERNIVEKKWQCNNIVAGTVILVHNPEKRDLTNKIAKIQQEYFREILSVQQFLFSPTTCFEVFAVRGQSYKLTELSDKLISLKGIRHGKLVMTRADEEARGLSLRA
ncbi:MAG: nickel-responsive transcriptional regulator NikR [Prevotellaceae bacterium]|jgi:CopG family nickel-responsive transcriptional regulator|nr:nickel-responsive transcriptional regulator NikR [Prevotellaceae bacterium]